jgi:glycerophosphoryl diester phosphodiesterase
MALRDDLRPPALRAWRPGRGATIAVGHRGAPLEYPENSLEGFDRAVALGAWMVELDVRATSDGALAVFHDEDLERLTGRRGTVAAAASGDLAGLRVDGWSRIPLLAEVLARLKERAWVNVEVKAAPDVSAVAGPVRALGMTDQVVVSSFDWDLLDRLRREAPELIVALLAEERLADPVRAIRERGARGLHPRHDWVDEALVAELHAAGAFVVPWTVDDPAVMRRLADLGADGLVSNDVATLVRVLA